MRMKMLISLDRIDFSLIRWHFILCSNCEIDTDATPRLIFKHEFPEILKMNAAHRLFLIHFKSI